MSLQPIMITQTCTYSWSARGAFSPLSSCHKAGKSTKADASTENQRRESKGEFQLPEPHFCPSPCPRWSLVTRRVGQRWQPVLQRQGTDAFMSLPHPGISSLPLAELNYWSIPVSKAGRMRPSTHRSEQRVSLHLPPGTEFIYGPALDGVYPRTKRKGRTMPTLL